MGLIDHQADARIYYRKARDIINDEEEFRNLGAAVVNTYLHAADIALKLARQP